MADKIYYCKFCGRPCLSPSGNGVHERQCIKNPNRKLPEFTEESKKRQAWSKGLNKETDIRLKEKAARAKGKNTQPYNGLASTAEKEILRRQKISTTMKANKKAGGLRQGSGRGKKGWYKGFFCDSTYELAYIIYNLDHNISFKRCPKTIKYEYTYNNEKHIYYPDFILDDGTLVEIKGYHTNIVDIKIQAVKDRSIKILYEKDLKYAFDYIKDYYNTTKIEELYEK